MNTFKYICISIFFTSSLFGQIDTLYTIYEIQAPGVRPWGLTSDGENLWISDDSLNNIYRLSQSGDVLHSFHVNVKQLGGICFMQNSLWTICKKALRDTLVEEYYEDSLYQYIMPVYSIYEIDTESGAVLDSIEFIGIYKSKTPFWGIEYFQTKFFVSFNGGWGESMVYIDPLTKNYLYFIGHACGLSVIKNGLWCVRPNSNEGPGNTICPKKITYQYDEDSTLIDIFFHDDWENSYKIIFFASDITYLDSTIWLCDPYENKIKKMVSVSSSVLFQEHILNKPDFRLGNNYPNPFNNQTIIPFELNKTRFIDLSIYNIRGQSIKTLIRGKQNPGLYNISWYGTDDYNEHVNSGVYFYKLSIDQELKVQSMVLIK